MEKIVDGERLAAEVLDPGRTRPIVLLTSRNREREPALDPDEVRETIGGDAILYFMESGPATDALDAALPPKFGAWHGAGRIWWPGVSQSSDPYAHPLIHDPYGVYGKRAMEGFRKRWRKGPPGAVEAVEPELVVAERDRDRARERQARAEAEATALRTENAAMSERLAAAERSLRAGRQAARSAQRSAARKASELDRAGELQVLITQRWAGALTEHDRFERPLRAYRFGPRFLDVVGKVVGATDERVAWVCAMVACGRAPEIDGLDLHQLRTGVGGSDPQRRRESDGALAWRCAVKVRQPSAPRLHYWVLPDGTIEFADVVKHDDTGITA